MTIKLENKIAEDLIKFKLQWVKETLNKILKNRDQKNAEDFIEKARSGLLVDAEMDAITVRQLLSDLDELESLLVMLK